MKATRWLVWLQIIAMWMPLWALYALLIATAHADASLKVIILASTWAILVAALLAIPVRKHTEKLPLSRPVTARFILGHLVGIVAFSIVWVLLTFAATLHTTTVRGATSFAFAMQPAAFLVMGAWLYIIIAGASYARHATERAGRAEALAAKSQLAALRSQLNPHFLFNALHTVMQLIPREPRLAANAAEQLAGLLRTGIEEDRDLIPLSREIEFVDRYLKLESIRFGDRLDVSIDAGDAPGDALIPSFSLQSLVENAVRHGVEPSETPVSVSVTARRTGGALSIEVRDTGTSSAGTRMSESRGTGLSRLRERLAALYQNVATLEVSSPSGGGFIATMSIPLAYDD